MNQFDGCDVSKYIWFYRIEMELNKVLIEEMVGNIEVIVDLEIHE